MLQDNDNQITTFAETTFRNRFRKFGIKTDDRRRHMYLVGKTGMGKSTILENMIIEDIRAGKGIAVVDPHGDLAEKIIKYIPPDRINDVIYFNPADMEYPIAFNVVEQVEPHLRHLVASGLIGVFQKLWADSWGPRLEYILRNAILAILDYPGSTLLAVTRMLSDKPFRKKVIDKIQDPVVKAFWVNEFAGYADKFASEAVSPIQNKVGQFLSSSLIRNIVGQVKSSIDLRQIMDEGKILIMNLSKGRIGEDNAALLGAMMITKIQLAVMSRVDVNEHERKDFYLYIDEFQNFTTESFANILSEARKYRLNLIMAHQYIEQLGDTVKAAVFGNVGTLMVFRVGAADAEELVKEFSPIFNEEDLVNLPKFEMYLKLMIDGISSDPFSAKGLSPLTVDEETGNMEKTIQVSRERYAKKKEVVEDKIMRWHVDKTDPPTATPPAGMPASITPTPRSSRRAEPWRESGKKSASISASAPACVPRTGRSAGRQQTRLADSQHKMSAPADDSQKHKREIRSEYGHKDKADYIESDKNKDYKKNEIYQYNAVCSRCGKATNVSFEPDGVRPIFCKECLAQARKEKKAEIEDRKKAKKKELAELKQKEISLKNVMHIKPVDFHGKKINKQQAISTALPVRQTSLAASKVKAENDNNENELKEGAEVRF
ncbi:MAG: type IV secretion system DNA-binding domain-containing protein [Patescibacteria group bacterium]|nr:type IV secretion system DNA-binding domain-containing protein [Patescibacteria group bacterium]